MMSLRNTAFSYGSIAKSLHWLIALLVIVMLCVGFFMGDIKSESLQGMVYNTHKLIGLSILVLILLRAAWTLTNPKPVLPPDTQPWQRDVEWTVHFLFYACLIAMPLAGWIGSTAAGYMPHLWGIEIGLPIAKNKLLTNAAFSVHTAIAWTLIGLITVHVGAALYHYLIKKDNILQRMLP